MRLFCGAQEVILPRLFLCRSICGSRAHSGPSGRSGARAHAKIAARSPTQNAMERGPGITSPTVLPFVCVFVLCVFACFVTPSLFTVALFLFTGLRLGRLFHVHAGSRPDRLLPAHIIHAPDRGLGRRADGAFLLGCASQH